VISLVQEGRLKDQLLQAIAPGALSDDGTPGIWTNSYPIGDPATLFIGWRLQLGDLPPILPPSIGISSHSCTYADEKKLADGRR
jgi:hypothetical protein